MAGVQETGTGRLRVGVVGLGLWGQNHPLVYDDYHRSELAVVCDLDEGRAKAFAQQYGCEWTTRVSELAASDVPAFSVATPDPFHFEPTRELLAAGKHVLVEKPLTTSVAEAEAVTELAEQQKVVAMVDYHLRWEPRWCLVKDAVEAGRIGTPKLGYIRLSDAIEVATDWLSWAGRSGPQWFLFPHTMDLARWILGREPVRVFAMGQRGVLAAAGVDCWDAIQAMVAYEDGAQITFETSWIAPSGNPSVIDWHATLYGDEGKIDLDHDYNGLTFVDRAKSSTPWVQVGARDRWGKLDNYVYAPMRYFVDCVLAGVQPECSFRDGLAGVRLIDAVLQSLESGAPVDLAGPAGPADPADGAQDGS